jgi:hypothetical protein
MSLKRQLEDATVLKVESIQSKLIRLLIPVALVLGVAWGLAHYSKAKLLSTVPYSAPGSAFDSTSHSAPAAFTDADFARHVDQLKKRLPSKEFSIIVQKPFVVIGDEPERVVKQRAEDTVKWAVARLKQDFFTKDPEDILDIWLFKDEASYEKHAQLLFGERPTTPYGYYSSTHKALIMNIATGGGTLVHEIVHPFMEANFPACPPWLNEGLGSLYEQCGEEDGHIHGFTNWRLPGLQRAIREKRVPSFKTLTSMNSSAFYNDDRGTNYAQSRYLCYYLQEKGVLVKYYQEFVARQKEDPSGYQSLQKVLGEPDMDAFKSKWEKYVMGLE